MKKYFILIALLGSTCLAQVTVRLASPVANSTVAAPLRLQASASSSHTITAWHAYLDSSTVYTAGSTTSIDASVNVPTGKHTLVVRAWDSTGAYGTQIAVINVSTSAPAPAPSSGPISVQLLSPTSGSSTGSQVSLSASASSSHSITAWHAYLDSASIYSAGSTGSISTTLNVPVGTHTLVVRAWDSTGAYASQSATFTVGGGSAPTPAPSGSLPAPPSSAKVFKNIENMNSGWGICGTASCAGGSGSGNFWQAFYQSNPSLDGSSMELFRDGVWANALWYKKLGAINSATHFLWDFYVRLDSNSLKSGQALEYDAFQFVGGYNYMMGTQCDYGRGVWDTWSESRGQWLPTSIPCPKFSANTWHHIQWYITTNHSNHSYTYVTLVVDGKAYHLNQTQYAKYLAWGDNLGAQWQLDVNATGIGYHEWVDKANLTVW